MLLTPSSTPGGQGAQERENFVENKKREEMNVLSKPRITLELINDGKGHGDKINMYNILDGEGNDIGFVDIGVHKTNIMIGDISIKEVKRNKGYGKLIYKELVRINKLPLISYMATPEADRVRESLQKEGITETNTDGERILKVQNIIFFEGIDNSKNKITIKEIQERNSKDLENMLKEIAYHNNTAKQEKREKDTNNYSSNSDKFACIVYDRTNKPIAYRLAKKEEDLPINETGITTIDTDDSIIKTDANGKYSIPNCAHNSKFGVLEEEQGKGIGEILHRESAKEIIKRRGSQGIWLECKERNKKVYSKEKDQTIYEKRGYKRICTYQDEKGDLHFIDYKSREDVLNT